MEWGQEVTSASTRPFPIKLPYKYRMTLCKSPKRGQVPSYCPQGGSSAQRNRFRRIGPTNNVMRLEISCGGISGLDRQIFIDSIVYIPFPRNSDTLGVPENEPTSLRVLVRLTVKRLMGPSGWNPRRRSLYWIKKNPNRMTSPSLGSLNDVLVHIVRPG